MRFSFKSVLIRFISSDQYGLRLSILHNHKQYESYCWPAAVYVCCQQRLVPKVLAKYSKYTSKDVNLVKTVLLPLSLCGSKKCCILSNVP